MQLEASVQWPVCLLSSSSTAAAYMRGIACVETRVTGASQTGVILLCVPAR